jgi:inositol 1,4,5-triphosphate receptor type 1
MKELNFHMSCLIWTITLVSLAIVFTLPRVSGIRTLVAAVILRFIFSIGPEPTLWLLGSITVHSLICFLVSLTFIFISLQVIFKGIHIISIIGNHGTLEKHFLKIITDAELLYHFGYLTFCVFGILLHPFFYSVLVSMILLAHVCNLCRLDITHEWTNKILEYYNFLFPFFLLIFFFFCLAA